MATEQFTHNYFVDETGDLALFDKRGRTIVGKTGVSRVFMVGVAHLPDPQVGQQKLEKLRSELLADPYFKDVPSMRSEANKTAICFHAKDDLPEVRREVFKLLPEIDPKVQVVIRRKEYLAKSACSHQGIGWSWTLMTRGINLMANGTAIRIGWS